MRITFFLSVRALDGLLRSGKDKKERRMLWRSGREQGAASKQTHTTTCAEESTAKAKGEKEMVGVGGSDAVLKRLGERIFSSTIRYR